MQPTRSRCHPGPSMQCLDCGCYNNATNQYCEGCGTALGTECAACGHVNGPAARFCGRCSTALRGAASAPANQPWQQVLRSLHAKGGESSCFTILFATSAIRPVLSTGWETPSLG